MNIIIKISDFINEIIKKVITIFLMIMTVVLFSQVVSRYIFSSGLSWSEELVRYLCVWLIFFGATCATKDGSQIAVTALEESLVGISRKILYYIQNIIVLIFSIFLLRIGMLTLETAKMQTSPNMEIPMNIIYLVIPMSMVIMIIHLISTVLENIKKSRLT